MEEDGQVGVDCALLEMVEGGILKINNERISHHTGKNLGHLKASSQSFMSLNSHSLLATMIIEVSDEIFNWINRDTVPYFFFFFSKF